MKKKIQHVVINRCYGGFSLSRKAFLRLRELKEPTSLAEPDYGELYDDGSGPRKAYSLDSFCCDVPRDSKLLIKVIKELGKDSFGVCADLKVVKIPAGVKWRIEEYDGLEWIAEEHRTWR